MALTYGWARDTALMLIDQYSIAGEPVKESYNNQADYLKKIPRLLDDAAVLAATTNHRIRAVAELISLERREYGGFAVFALPEDFWQPCGGLIRFTRGRIQRFGHTRMLGSNQLAVPLDAAGGEGVALEYFRYPVLLGAEPAEDAPLDNTISVQNALPYYAAARLVMLDNPYAYQTLYNEFDSRLAVPSEVPRAEYDIIEDPYNSLEWEEYGWDV